MLYPLLSPTRFLLARAAPGGCTEVGSGLLLILVDPQIVNTNIQRMDRSHNASALPTLLRLELYSPIFDLPRAMLHTIPAALANGPPLPKSLPASRYEAAEAALNLATSVLNVALATASETLSACSPLISALEPYALTVAETYVLPLFQRTPEVAARVVLAGEPSLLGHPTLEKRHRRSEQVFRRGLGPKH